MMKTVFNALIFLLLSSSQLPAQSLNIGHVRIDYIMSQLPAAKEASNQLTLQQTQVQSELKRLQKELADNYALYQKQAGTLSDDERRNKEKNLRELQQRIEEFAQAAEQSLQAKYKQLMNPVITTIQQTIDTVAKQNGYTYIINVSSENGVTILYALDELDCSDLVLKAMDTTATKKISDLSQPNSKRPAKNP